MSLPAVTQSLDAVDPTHHDLYSQTDAGTFVLNIAGDLAGHPAVAPLENAYRKEQDKRKRQGRELDALKGQLTGNGNAADAKSLATAARLIDTFGATASLETMTKTDDLTSGTVSETVSAAAVKITPPEPLAIGVIDGTLVQAGDMTTLVAAQGTSAPPVANRDRLVFAAETWQIVAVDPIYSGDAAAAYRLQLRR